MSRPPNRPVALTLSPLALVVAGLLMARVASAAPAAHDDFAGVWEVARPLDTIRTLEGKAPPLLPEAARVYEDHRNARRKGDTSFDSTTWCAAAGMPRLMTLSYPFELVIGPQYVTFLHEWNGWSRVVYLDPAMAVRAEKAARGEETDIPPATVPPINELDPRSLPTTIPPPGAEIALPVTDPGDGLFQASAMGFSTGRWEGDTLAIDTSSFIDSTLLDNSGLPHSDQMKLTERIRLRGHDLLEDRIRVEDAATYKTPWEFTVQYQRRRGESIPESVCLDNIAQGQPAIRSGR